MITPRTVLTPDAVSRHYDELDRFYREIWGDHVHHGLWPGDDDDDGAAKRLVEYVINRSELSDAREICDVGCGYGATANLLANRFGAKVTGLTLSPRQVAYASDNYSSTRCSFRLGDWMNSGFPSGAFDVVLAIESLSHMPDKKRFFDEAFRVLRPSGRLVVCAWLAGDAPSRRESKYLLEPICREGRLPSLCNRSEVTALFRESGFDLFITELLSDRVRRTWTVCAGRLSRKLISDPKYATYLLRGGQDSRFLLTIARIMIAYRSRAMEYGLFVARKRPSL